MNDGLLYKLLHEEIIDVISSLPEELYGFVKEPLTVSRRGLAVADEHEPPWILLPLIVCESIGGSTDKALPLCASLQFFMARRCFPTISDNDARCLYPRVWNCHYQQHCYHTASTRKNNCPP